MKTSLLSKEKVSVYWRAAFSLALLSVAFVCLVSKAAAAHSEKEVEAGIVYWNDRFPEKPLSIHVIKVDRHRSDFRFVTTKAKDSVVGLATLTDQLKLIPGDFGTPKVAINGDFYKTERERYPGDPRGLLIVRGELISSPIDRACMWFDTKGEPHTTTVLPQFNVVWPNGDKAAIGLNEDPGRNGLVLFTPRLG